MVRKDQFMPGYTELICDGCGDSYLKRTTKAMFEQEKHYCRFDCKPEGRGRAKALPEAIDMDGIGYDSKERRVTSGFQTQKRVTENR